MKQLENNEKQELLKKSARKLFEKHGYKKVSIDEIVKEAGVAKGTFYLYFKNKDDIYCQIFEQYFHLEKPMMKFLKKSKDVRNMFYEKIIVTLYFFSHHKILREIIIDNPNYQSPSVNFKRFSKHALKRAENCAEEHINKIRKDISMNDLMRMGSFLLSIFEYEKVNKEMFWSMAEKFAKVYVDGLLSDHKWETRKTEEIIGDFEKSFVLKNSNVKD